MRRNVGLTLAAATLLVSSRFSAGPGAQAPPAEQVVGRVPIPGTPVKDADQSKNKLQGKCTAYDRKLGARNFPSDDTQSAAYKVITKFVDESKYADPAQYDHLKFVIALVPDPKHTNLSLFFDRQMAAIQAAAQDEGYSYDSSWMPWKLSNRAYPLLADDQFRAESDEDRESCPGIITFWQDPVDLKAGSSGQTRYENGLMVLVVGEQPTGGLNQDQWTNAVNWISGRMSETREDRILRVLGPTFSGSLIPFEHALEKLEHSPGKPRTFNQIQVLSGTISSCRLLTWFQHQSPANVVLGSFQENDALQLYRFLDFIHKRGWQTEDVAIISEDETSYARNVADMGSLGSCGSSFWTTDKQPVSLSYPRDISALRVEYQKQAVGINNTERSTHLVLNENAEVPDLNTEADDTIGAYAGPMTPLNQEAILYGIVGYLRTHHTRYIILRCTNPLDFLFLARFFHRAYPLGRIVTEGSELLFVRELETNDFRGLMALSTYPLRPSGEWLPLNPQGPHVHRVFEAHTVEGEYLAGRYSFGSYKISRTTGQHGSSLLLQVTNPLPDIEPPNWVGIAQSSTRLHAPTWVSVLAREGYWPVSVLNSEEPEEGKTPTSTLVHYKLDTAARPEVYKTPWIPISWQVCQGLAMALFAYELFGLAAGSKFSSLALLAPFRRSRSSSHLFLLGENAGLASALLLLFLLLDFGSQATQLSSPALFCLSWRLWLGIFVGGLLLGLFSRWSSNWILPFVCGFILCARGHIRRILWRLASRSMRKG